MDCGVPFCHEGCPLGNLIPDWNDLVYRGKWREAIDQLHATNNFPEFTGRICPAPCESACVLAINDDAVTIEQIEMAIAERAFEEGWVVPEPPARRSGKTVGVVGSGPAGLAVAAELNRCGHLVTVYERDEGPGGLMRFGVPDAKLEKSVIDRRVGVLEQEGITFVYDAEVGSDVTVAELQERHDAVVIAIGSRVSRDIVAPGPRERRASTSRWTTSTSATAGSPSTRAGRSATSSPDEEITRRRQEGDRDRRRRHRHGLHLQRPARGRRRARRSSTSTPSCSSPIRATRGRCRPSARSTTYALDEGGKRRWGTEVTGFGGKDGKVTHVYARKVTGTSSRDLTPVPGSEFVVEADLVLIAIGFEHPEHEGLVSELDLDLDRRGNIRTEQTYKTSHAGCVRLRRRAHRPVAGRDRDRRGPQVRARRQQGARRHADGPGP